MCIRKNSSKLLVDITRSLFNQGILPLGEFAEIRDAITSLAVTLPKPTTVEEKFLTGPEVAAKLGISFSQFKQLLSEGAFPFKRHFVGKKSSRFLLSEVLHYMAVTSVEGNEVSLVRSIKPGDKQ